MNFDELTMLDPEDIPYTELSDEFLRKLIFENEDLYMATYALGELSRRNSSLVTDVALKILDEGYGDEYLQAKAFNSLYFGNRELAIDQIADILVNGCKSDLLLEIIRMIVMDINDFYDNPELKKVASELVEYVEKFQTSDFKNDEDVEVFLKKFAGLG